jgi:SAM-dependent methyltransferase
MAQNLGEQPTAPVAESTAGVYDRSVANGHYILDTGGLSGKHDNVRRYWEDDLTRQFLRPMLRRALARHYWGAAERLRIFDLGCGSGQGYELITSVRARDAGIYQHSAELLPRHAIARYVGCDLSEGMVQQARQIYGEGGKFDFRTGDFGVGLPVRPEDAPFHLYFSSYGSLSHIDTRSLISLLQEIGAHAESGACVVLDLLGRYSYEWPCYWGRRATDEDDMWDYSMSYLPGESPESSDCWHMRYWTSEEVAGAVEQACIPGEFELRLLDTFDRSLLVGRHIDTCQYNPQAPRLRSAVNRLHESNVRTDLAELLFDYCPHPTEQGANVVLERLAVAWNGLVHFCMDKLSSPDGGADHLTQLDAMPPALRQSIITMNRVIDNVGWMEMGDPRANIIEPQLGYALRRLEQSMQPGEGFGHGLLVGIEVVKST